MNTSHKNWLFTLVLFMPSVAFAHQQIGVGLIAGLTHPVLGMDHLLAMISVGVLSAQIGGNAIFRVPATFVAVMLLGGFIGMLGLDFTAVELGIALSVLVLGIAIAIGRKMPTWISMIFVGVFAIFHGYAHGAEMPTLAEPFMYAFGFVLGTSLIHLVGVFIGLFATRTNVGANLLRFSGVIIAGIGLQIILS